MMQVVLKLVLLVLAMTCMVMASHKASGEGSKCGFNGACLKCGSAALKTPGNCPNGLECCILMH